MQSRFTLYQCLKCLGNTVINFWLHLTEQSLCSGLSDGKELLGSLNLTLYKGEAKRYQPCLKIYSLAPTGTGMGNKKGGGLQGLQLLL